MHNVYMGAKWRVDNTISNRSLFPLIHMFKHVQQQKAKLWNEYCLEVEPMLNVTDQIAHKCLKCKNMPRTGYSLAELLCNSVLCVTVCWTPTEFLCFYEWIHLLHPSLVHYGIMPWKKTGLANIAFPASTNFSLPDGSAYVQAPIISPKVLLK